VGIKEARTRRAKRGDRANGSKLVKLRKGYYSYLDGKAKYIASQLSENRPVTKLILDYVKELYASARSGMFADKDKNFEAAYHNPISSDLEFLVARALYHYSKNLGWKILLRCQKDKSAPDIRIERDDKTLGIIEVKARAGWIQNIFSEERYIKEKGKFEDGERSSDPAERIDRFRHQLEKYYQTYGIEAGHVFVLLPSFALVHRKRSTLTVRDYKSFFSINSNLPEDSLVVLSDNPSLDLSREPSRKEYKPTSEFEKMVRTLTKLSKR
jgi:hypothetical protein